MNIMSMKSVLILSLTILGCCASGSKAGAIFTTDFEGSLAGWTGKDGGPHHGVLVDDPVRPGNQVLTFTALNAGGDIYSAEPFHLTSGQRYRITLEYLGLPVPGSVPGDLGGFAGLSEDLPGKHMWYYGTSPTADGINDAFIDDGQWREYSFEFVAPVTLPFAGGGVSSDLRLVFEDFSGSQGVPGDVYFDNVQLSSVNAVPVPSSMRLLASAFAALFVIRPRIRGILRLQ